MEVKATENYYTITTLSPAAIWLLSLLGFVLAVVFVIAYVQIVRRAGYSGWWILILLVPVLNVVMLLIFAYKEWPIQRELRELRGWANQIQRGPAPSGYPQDPAYGGYGSGAGGTPGGTAGGYGPPTSGPATPGPAQSGPPQSESPENRPPQGGPTRAGHPRRADAAVAGQARSVTKIAVPGKISPRSGDH